ncbi:MAG: hypothetical protein PHX61_06195, partial [Alphaproteobacteria bacterium]|nr:hypothetical protein [Alphaproteobacteria bacterium]
PDTTATASLYDSKYNYIGEFTGSLDLNGTYYIKVSDTNYGYAVNYALSMTQNSNSFDDAVVLDSASSPAVYSKTYAEGDNADFFKFTASGKYDLVISGSAALTLYEQDRETLIEMPQPDGFYNFDFNGTYYIKTDVADSYALNLSKSNNTIANAIEIEETNGISGSITSPDSFDPTDYYKFTVSGKYDVGILGNINAAVTLLDNNGGVIDSITVTPESGEYAGLFTNRPLSGTYYLQVEGINPEPAELVEYSVRLLRNNNSFENAQDITPVYNYCNVTATDESDYLRFTANSISSINVSDNDNTVSVTLYDSDRNEITGSTTSYLSFDEALSGTFYLKVDNINPDDNGKYSVSLSAGNNGATENNSFETATRFDVYTGNDTTLTTDDAVDYYIVNAKGYYNIGIQDASAEGMKVTLYDVSLKQIGQSVVALAEDGISVSGGIIKDVNLNGTYYVKVEGSNELKAGNIPTETYLNLIDDSDDTFESASVITPANGNGWGSGLLDQNDTVDFFKFTVDSSYDLSFSNYGDASLTLYNQNRVEVNPETTTDDFGNLNMNLDAGTYYAKLEIGAASLPSSIDYSLSLSKSQIA